MPRTARPIDSSGDSAYHITVRGNNRRATFMDEEDKCVFLAILANAKKKHSFELFHYVIMTNHFHLMIRPESGRYLWKIMKDINQKYSLFHKKKYAFIGHLWQGRYNSEIVADDGYALTAGLYIELNPVRAGMVNAPEEYEWSSYEHYAFGRKNPLVDENPAFRTLGPSYEKRRGWYQRLASMWRARSVPKGTVPMGGKSVIEA